MERVAVELVGSGGLEISTLDELTACSWPIERHTEAKLRILGAYLKAWFPILSLGGHQRVLYIDGFSGPGRYLGGEDGSPIVALKSLAAQRLSIKSSFEFHFVEKKPGVASTLRANVDYLQATGGFPDRSEVFFYEGQSFEEAYENGIRDRLIKYANTPAFALVDPFGWTGIPMRIVGDLINRPSTEVFVNFMFEEINRFLAHKDQPENFDQLFGGGDWRAALELSGRSRQQKIYDYYHDRLREVGGARFVRSFEMRNARGVVDYFLFFASNSAKGLAKMKEAMWKVDPEGRFSFSDATNPQQVTLFATEPDHGLLRRLIREHCSGRLVTIQQIEIFVVEKTPFLATHYKKVLKELEAKGLLTVPTPPAGRKTGTFPISSMHVAIS
jgi:three-Cys-motif partner protein